MLRLIQIHSLLFAMWLVAPIIHAQETEKPAQEKSEMLVARILVLDPDGHPLDGATVTPSGLRTKVKPTSHWSWSRKVLGPEPTVITNSEGIAEVPYPKYIMEDLETGKMTWSVDHPEYVSFRGDRSVDDNPAEIKLARGFRVAVTAVQRDSGDPVTTDLYATTSISSYFDYVDWKLHENGTLVSPVFPEGNIVLCVMQIVADQPVLFSEMITIKPEGRSRILLKDVRLAPGTRVEGRLAEYVDRPVRNGFVAARVLDGSLPGGREQCTWHDKVPIAEDGTFVFASLPSDQIVQLLPLCDNWVPKSPDKESVLKYYPESISILERGNSLPQLFELANDVITPVLEMEPASSVRIIVKGPDGMPLANAEVYMSPNQRWFDFGSQILGMGGSSRIGFVANRNGVTWPPSSNPFSATTDQNGVAVIHNLPTKQSIRMSFNHEEYELPVNEVNGPVTVELKPGEENQVTFQMQKKGAEVLGADKDEKANEGKAPDGDSEVKK